MAAIASGMFNHSMTAAQALSGTNATPMASPQAGAADSSATSSSTSTISANDFLTLLVTEMKNQDPTATTDPNEYINQLVNVNSLQQLISINQNLSTALGISPSASSGTGQVAAAASAESGTDSLGGTAPTGAADTGTAQQSVHSAAKLASGNLSAPDVNPAASTLAHALDGHARGGALAGGSFGVQ